MKKYCLILLLFLALNITSTVYAEPDISKGIERSIVTKIEWNDEKKVILIHLVLVKKFINQPIVINNDFTTPVRADAFKNSTLTNEEARNFVIQHFPSFGVDHIFGQEVKVFKDLSDQKEVSQNDIDNATQELKTQIEIDWNNPQNFSVTKPSLWVTIWEWIKALKEMIIAIVGIFLFAFWFFPKQKKK